MKINVVAWTWNLIVQYMCQFLISLPFHIYRNDPKFLGTQNICCNPSKVWTMWLYHRLMSPNVADGMANSVNPDQTAPLGAVWSGSALFAQAYLSENLGSLRYFVNSRKTSIVKELP